MKHKPLLWQGKPLTAAWLLRLQQQAGNRAVVRLLHALRDQANAPEPIGNSSTVVRLNTPKHDEHKKLSWHKSRPNQATSNNPEKNPHVLHRDNAIAGRQKEQLLRARSDSMLSLPPGKRHWLVRLFWWLVWLLTFGLVDRRSKTLQKQQQHSGQGG